MQLDPNPLGPALPIGDDFRSQASFLLGSTQGPEPVETDTIIARPFDRHRALGKRASYGEAIRKV